MRRLFFILFIVFVLCWQLSAQTRSVCPKTGIYTINSVVEPGDIVNFRFSLNEEAKNPKLEYKWTVSGGTMLDGQATSSIRVATPRVSQLSVTAAVEIKGLPANCINEFSKTVAAAVYLTSQEYETKSSSVERINLDRFITIIARHKDFVATFYLDFKEPASRRIDSRVRRIINYLTTRGLPYQDRITFVAVKSDRDLNRIFYRYREDRELIRSDREIIKIIKGSDFDLEKRQRLSADRKHQSLFRKK